ncbi:MAG: hypothetical protein GY946_22105 [bacterium]|nr:hypothetical protein [bacterium]
MYTRDALLDLHRRTQKSFAGLLDHCAGFSAEELNRALAGFGYETIQLQLCHQIGAQAYWLSVIRGQMDARDDSERYTTIAQLNAYRQEVATAVEAYLQATDEAALNRAQPLETWGGATKDLCPALVIMRTLTHIFQHNGQVAAMCRLLGRPIPAGLDFPIV